MPPASATAAGAIATSAVFEAERHNQPDPAEQQVVAQAPSPKPVSEAPEYQPVEQLPHGITVYRGGTELKIERITFESTQSRNILALSEGPINSTSSMMRAGTDGRMSPAGAGNAGSAVGTRPDGVDASDTDLEPETDDDGEAG